MGANAKKVKTEGRNLKMSTNVRENKRAGMNPIEAFGVAIAAHKKEMLQRRVVAGNKKNKLGH